MAEGDSADAEMTGLRLAPVSLLAGIALAVATVGVYAFWWGLVLAAAATLAVTLATPRGWATRLPLALGFVGVVALTSVPRSEGSYLVASTASGYVVLGLGLVVLCVTIATLPRPRRREIPRLTGESSTLE